MGFEAVAPLPSAIAAWTRCRAGLLRVGAVVDAVPVMSDPRLPAPPPGARIGIEGDAISVAPASAAALVLREAELHIEPGSRVAVTGPSGCGKSTLLGVVLRLIPVEAGTLALRGSDHEVALSRLRAADVPPLVAGSLQGDHVFDATLRDNLRVVRPEALDADLDLVAGRAGLLDFVDTLPGRWSTPAGPDGATLSGGQRQRLLLARALLADPQVLVLDEPTAHLDAVTERAVLDDLRGATAGRTVLLSTHRRLQTGDVDRVLHLDRGTLLDEQQIPSADAPNRRLEPHAATRHAVLGVIARTRGVA